VAQAWIDYALNRCLCPYPEKGNCARLVKLSTQFTCEDCGYYQPNTKEPCLMCKGLVSSWGYEFKHGLPSAVPLHRCGENSGAILTNHHTMHFLGLMCKHGDLTQ
jgi:hypothetical protein